MLFFAQYICLIAQCIGISATPTAILTFCFAFSHAQCVYISVILLLSTYNCWNLKRSNGFFCWTWERLKKTIFRLLGNNLLNLFDINIYWVWLVFTLTKCWICHHLYSMLSCFTKFYCLYGDIFFTSFLLLFNARR